ncbi:hypothetical protein FCV62_01660 [Vibrio kanaloae]|jgi:hypothetical protein|uniref:Uncharacterized protein n=1 Tax=Vibrio kanaloae TaxID=170673 RepID=A0A4U2D010_9VIBR|nr:hypothetical protein [Vibrio kanaloae]TKF31832.1 hypothetical protein FCV50_10680 [Vibrio kanaloae]TKF82140.1 hypothetical protein FCV62_01660 [Vibrio kanaloae]
MKYLVVIWALLAFSVQASCFVVSDLKGFSTRQFESFEIDKDGISSQKFIVEFKGEESSVSPNNMNCFQVGSSTLICADVGTDGESTIETWAVYPGKEKAVYTKSINGFGDFNGANMFVGNIKGRCD